MMRSLAPAVIASSLLLTGCSAASGAPASAPAPTSSAPARYLLGDVATTTTPVPDCSLALAGWTAAHGPVEVTVLDLPGPTAVAVVVTPTTGAAQTMTATFGGTHVFEFDSASPAQVAKVEVSATTNDSGVGGSCMATGSPTA